MLLPPTESIKVDSTAEPADRDLKGSGLILVVDDEKIIQQTTKAILERNGNEVLTAGDGEAGVEAVRKNNKDKLAAIILDLTMPVMSGEEALVHIEKIAPTVPVILSSGFDTSEAIDRFGGDRLAGFLQKPSTVAEMLQKVQEVIRKRGSSR